MQRTRARGARGGCREQETYSLSVDSEKQALVLRTTNKKYYKVFRIPALCRAGLPLQRSSTKMAHNGRSTLVLSYEKPASVVEEEREARASAVRDGGTGAGAAKEKGLVADGAMAAPAAGVGRREGPSECRQS